MVEPADPEVRLTQLTRHVSIKTIEERPMSNRNMKAKGDKARRQRRLFPRHLSASFIPVGKPPNQLVMRELKERSRSLAFDDEYIDYLVKRRFMDQQGQHISEGRRLVSAHIRRIQETVPTMTSVSICDTLVKKTLLFYNESRDRFIIYEANRVEKFVRTSMVYMDRKRCVDAWKSDTTRWVYFSSVHPPSDSSSE